MNWILRLNVLTLLSCALSVAQAQNFRFTAQNANIQQIAAWVIPGKYDCYGQQTVLVSVRKDHPGYIDLTFKGHTYHMLPVPSNTGAVRLESKASGMFWLQLSVKSMLFSNAGSRIADDCHNRAAALVVAPVGESLNIQVPDLPIAPPPPPPSAAEQKQITE